MKKIMNSLFCVLMAIVLSASVLASSSVPKAVIKATESVVRVLAEYPNGYAMGSGFIIKGDEKETLVATNYHVVEDNPYSISVWIDEEEMVSATIFAYTAQKDMCILKLTVPVMLEPLPLSENGAVQGEAVYAVGFPSAADYLSDKEAHTSAEATITDGIVSATRETTVSNTGAPMKLLQINAAINAGNSGGPLFNANGEVVGINTLGASDSQGIFGAIDISELRTFLLDHSIVVSERMNEFPWNMVAFAFTIIAVISLIVANGKKQKRQDKRGCTSAKTTIVVLAVLLVVMMATYFGCYLMARKNAEDERFVSAKNFLFIPQITEIHDSKLVDYIEAGCLMENREYSEAATAFATLNEYKRSETLENESKYRLAMQYADKNQFHEAASMLDKLREINYSDSRAKYNEIQYRWAWALAEEGEYVKAFRKLHSLSMTFDVEENLSALEEIMYVEGQILYEEGNYEEAEDLFECISYYSDSGKYMILIDAHQGSFVGLLPNLMVERLTSIFHFEDAADLLVSDMDIACCFLLGKWTTNDGSYYFEMETLHNEEYDYWCSYNLPWYDGDFMIEDGVFSVSTDDYKDKPQFKFELITPNSMEVYCYKDGLTYTLYR